MGNSLLCMVKSYFGYYPQMKLFMMGSDGAGKTTILYKMMKPDSQVVIIPTIGADIESIHHANHNLTILDISGRTQNVMYRVYSGFMEQDSQFRSLIYVVDSNDRERITDSAHALHWILSLESMKQHLKLLLILANKQDLLPEAMSIPEIRDQMKLETTIKPEIKWEIMGCSATTGDGITEAFDWIVMMNRK